MKLSANGRRLLQSFEGLSLTAYPDAHGYSIGYGHFGAKPGDTITLERAEALFDADVASRELAVSLKCPIASSHQFDSMVSLAYNIGVGAFNDSTLARLHAAGDYAGAAEQFPRWNKSSGAVNPALVDRRARERAVYLYGYQPYAGPTPAQPMPRASSSALPLLAAVGVGLFLLTRK